MTSASTAEVQGTPRQKLTLLVMCLALFMIQLDLTIVNVALPAIQRGLGATPGGLEWVISGYALSLAALIPVGGALGDRYGRRLVFIVGVVVFGLGSMACALSLSSTMLIVSRIVQGIGGAAMLALTLSIVTDTYPPQRRAAAIGVWAAIGGSGFGVGPVVGGLLLSVFAWQSVFWVNVPFAVVAIWGTVLAVGESRGQERRRLDVAGVASSALGLAAMTLGLIESASHPWGSWRVAGPLAFGVGLLVAFALWERRAPEPIIPRELFGARSFLSASAVYLTSYMAMTGVLFYVTLLYQNVNGWSALHTGLSWLLMNGPFLVLAQLAGRLDRRFPVSWVVAIGCLTGAIGVFALSRVTEGTPFALAAGGYVLSGAGFGMLSPGVAHVAMRDVPAAVTGGASGILNASRQIGTSVGLAVLGAIGVSAAVADWATKTSRLPPAVRARAAKQAQNVGGGHVTAVASSIGHAYRQPAVQSFLHGYHLAVGIGAACLLVAALTAAIGFRGRDRSGQETVEASLA